MPAMFIFDLKRTLPARFIFQRCAPRPSFVVTDTLIIKYLPDDQKFTRSLYYERTWENKDKKILIARKVFIAVKAKKAAGTPPYKL